jgi:hypothetical protein
VSRAFEMRCPETPAHGRLLPMTGARGWYCPHQAHGANGRFFTTAEAEAARPAFVTEASKS